MATTILNERQIKVLNRLLDTVEKFAQGINARKYQSLAEVSRPPPRGIWQNWWRKAAFPSFPAVGAARLPWRWVRAAC